MISYNNVLSLPFIPWHDDISLIEYLSLEPHVWVPNFRQLAPKVQEGLILTLKPSGPDGKHTKQDIMKQFFYGNLHGIEELGIPATAANGIRDGVETYPLERALSSINYFISSVISREEACSDSDEANLLLGVFEPWYVCAKVDNEKAIYLYNKYTENCNLIRLILDESKKLKPLRPWIELQTWTVKDFCFLREGCSPSDNSFTPDHDTEMRLIRYLASSQVKPVNCDPDKAQSALSSAAAAGIGSRCHEIQFKPADLLDCARKAKIDIPYYMRPHEKPDPGLLTEVFNTDHANHSPELAAALECWLALYAGSPEDEKTLAESKRTQWLKEKCSFELPIQKGASEPSPTMYTRIAKVVNPEHHKKGGAIPIQGKK